MRRITCCQPWPATVTGRKPVLIVGGVLAILSRVLIEPLLTQGSTWGVALFLCNELFLMGVTFAPMGTLLPELFPTHVRYTGASAATAWAALSGPKRHRSLRRNWWRWAD